MISTKPLHDLIGLTEGTDKGRGYNETIGFGHYCGEQNLTLLPLMSIFNLQKTILAKHAPSDAVGRYQIISPTLRLLVGRLGVSLTTDFSASLQDRFCDMLLEERGLSLWVAGRLTTSTFMDNLAHEWASLPYHTGSSVYGQRVGCTREHFMDVLKQVHSA